MFIRPRPAFRPRCLAVLVVLVGGSMTQAVSAQEPPPKTQDAPPRPEEATLPPVVVTAPPPVSASSEVFIPGRDFELRPQGRPADVLRLVPGLVISQHQGGGKAEQYFLRAIFESDAELVGAALVSVRLAFELFQSGERVVGLIWKQAAGFERGGEVVLCVGN